MDGCRAEVTTKSAVITLDRYFENGTIAAQLFRIEPFDFTPDFQSQKQVKNLFGQQPISFDQALVVAQLET